MPIKELPWEIIKFPTKTDDRGSLTMAQSGPNGLVPFDIKRTYWLHDIVNGGMRGSHATFHTNQVLIPLIGGCEIRLSDGVTWRMVELSAKYAPVEHEGLWIKSGTWREVLNFESGTVVLILADTLYEDADYCRDWSEYLERVGQGD